MVVCVLFCFVFGVGLCVVVLGGLFVCFVFVFFSLVLVFCLFVCVLGGGWWWLMNNSMNVK